MDSILDTRVPKGGGGFRYKGGSGSGGGGGGSLVWWAWLIIIFSVVWLFAYITLLVHFFRTGSDPTHSILNVTNYGRKITSAHIQVNARALAYVYSAAWRGRPSGMRREFRYLYGLSGRYEVRRIVIQRR